jgi:hypothetical protein
MPRPPIDAQAHEDRKYILIGMIRRTSVFGFNAHCAGCPKQSECGMPADDPKSHIVTIIECADRNGPLFANYLERKKMSA